MRHRSGPSSVDFTLRAKGPETEPKVPSYVSATDIDWRGYLQSFRDRRAPRETGRSFAWCCGTLRRFTGS